MKVFSEIHQIRQFIHQAKLDEKSIGFVPTMGALHQGHLRLIEESLNDNDITVCSIFVNPTQFNNLEDLKNYPRDLETDLALLEKIDCDMVFHPAQEIMYPSETITNFSFSYLEEIMEGKFRPGHFKGVGLVVLKLLNIIMPNRAYFGQKDLQQLTLIQTMIRDLNLNVEIIGIPTVREKDGLAMSSRNQLLSKDERGKAIDLYNALSHAKSKLNAGESVISVKVYVKDYFIKNSPIDLEYFEIVRTKDLKSVDEILPDESISLCIAGYLGKVRLIDNISLI